MSLLQMWMEYFRFSLLYMFIFNSAYNRSSMPIQVNLVFIYPLFKGRNYDFQEHSERHLWSDSETELSWHVY